MSKTIDFLGGQFSIGAHESNATEEQATPAANGSLHSMIGTPQGSKTGRGHVVSAPHMNTAPAHDILDGHRVRDAHARTAVEEQTAPPTSNASVSNTPTSAGPQLPSGQCRDAIQKLTVAGDQARPVGAKVVTKPNAPVPRLVDPLLALLAETLDDLERTRIANENRFRHLTRDVDDSDGERRGLGLSVADAPVAAVAAIVESLNGLEKDATKQLEKALRRHPLGPWIKAQKGVGDKQGARLLAAIGDPYWNDLHGRPRTVSELWAYCGLHVLPAGHIPAVPQDGLAGGDPNFRTGHADIEAQLTDAGPELNHPSGHGSNATHGSTAAGAPDTHLGHRPHDAQVRTAGVGQAGSDPGQTARENQCRVAGVAPARARGQRSNWSATAKMRAYLIAEACIKQLSAECKQLGENQHTDDCTCGHYRTVYDFGRIKYAQSVHPADCKRCGPSGKPAVAGTPLSAGHQHARAMRLVMKELLKDLWIQARAIHLEAEGAL